MENIKSKIVEILNNSAEVVYSKGSCGELGDSFNAIDSDYIKDIADEIVAIDEIKQLKHHKDTTIGLYAVDKNPQDLFRIIFCDMIEEIEMDGEKTFSAIDFEYYEKYFKKGAERLFFCIS